MICNSVTSLLNNSQILSIEQIIAAVTLVLILTGIIIFIYKDRKKRKDPLKGSQVRTGPSTDRDVLFAYYNRLGTQGSIFPRIEWQLATIGISAFTGILVVGLYYLRMTGSVWEPLELYLLMLGGSFFELVLAIALAKHFVIGRWLSLQGKKVEEILGIEPVPEDTNFMMKRLSELSKDGSRPYKNDTLQNRFMEFFLRRDENFLVVLLFLMLAFVLLLVGAFGIFFPSL